MPRPHPLGRPVSGRADGSRRRGGAPHRERDGGAFATSEACGVNAVGGTVMQAAALSSASGTKTGAARSALYRGVPEQRKAGARHGPQDRRGDAAVAAGPILTDQVSVHLRLARRYRLELDSTQGGGSPQGPSPTRSQVSRLRKADAIPPECWIITSNGAAFTDQNDAQSATISRIIGRHFWRADNFRKAGRSFPIRPERRYSLRRRLDAASGVEQRHVAGSFIDASRRHLRITSKGDCLSRTGKFQAAGSCASARISPAVSPERHDKPLNP